MGNVLPWLTVLNTRFTNLVFSGQRLVGWRWILGLGGLATLPVFCDSWLQLQCDQLSFALATVHTFLTDGRHPRDVSKANPSIFVFSGLAPQQQETPVVRLVCACGEDTTFSRASFSTYFLLSLVMCLPGTWVVSTPSDYLLWFQAFRLCCGLSSFWREKLSLHLDTSQCCLKFWIQSTQGLCIVLSWGTSLYWICCHTRSGARGTKGSMFSDASPLTWPV